MQQEKRWKLQSPLVTAPELPALVARHSVLALHCGAVWNSHDVGVDERLQMLRREFAPKVGIYALDIDDKANWDFLRDAPVLNITALVVFINGERQPTLIGTRSIEEMRERFQEWLILADIAAASAAV